MRQLAHSTAGNANLAVIQESGNSRLESGEQPGGIGWRDLFRSLWPTKTAAEFSYRTGTNVSHAERVLKGERGLSLETFLDLCAWPDGDLVALHVLRARCSDQPWFKDFERAFANADLDRRERELQELRRRVNALD